MSERLSHIDIARGFGILLVIAGHNWIILGNHGELFRMVYSFHVPLFFILAGLFFSYKKTISAVLKEKFVRLLLPYLFTLMIIETIALIFNFNLGTFVKSLVWILYGTGPQLRESEVIAWFLPHLILVSIFSWSIFNFFKKFKVGKYAQIIIMLILLTIGWLNIRAFWKMPIGEITVNGLPFSADLLLISSFYFMLGSFSQNWIKSNKFHLALLIIFSVIFFTLHSYTDVTIDLNIRRYSNLFVGTVLAITGSLIVIEVSRFLSRYVIAEKILGYFGKNSLIILIFHSFFQDNLFVLLSEYTKRFFYVGVATFITAILGSIIVIEIINRVNFLQKIYKN